MKVCVSACLDLMKVASTHPDANLDAALEELHLMFRNQLCQRYEEAHLQRL